MYELFTNKTIHVQYVYNLDTRKSQLLVGKDNVQINIYTISCILFRDRYKKVVFLLTVTRSRYLSSTFLDTRKSKCLLFAGKREFLVCILAVKINK